MALLGRREPPFQSDGLAAPSYGSIYHLAKELRQMKCPGQDSRYWGEDAAFEVPCPKCGHSVEIFKDESSAKCPACKHRFKNPKLDLKCPEWCAYAKECLGLTASPVKSSNLGEGALASHLIQVVKEEFSDDQAHITRALMAF